MVPYPGPVRVPVILPVALAALAAAGPTAAQPPGDLSAEPLDRGALLALPSIYRLDVTIRVTGLVTDDGPVALDPRARSIPEVGTAVAVAPGGWLVSAAHVATPDAATVARLVHQDDLAYREDPAHADDAKAAAWVERHHARPLGVRVDVRVSQADAGGGEDSVRAFRVLERRRDGAADLALIHIAGAQGAPALTLDESAGRGTEVATIGFGAAPALRESPRATHEPAVRRGGISRTGVLTTSDPPRSAIAMTVPVERGDSGAPLIDAAAQVRGIVTLRNPQGGVAERATEVRQLLESAGVTPGEGLSATSFRAAMTAFWRLDFAGAQRGFAATLEQFGAHTLAPVERDRAAALDEGTYTLSGHRRRGRLLAVGALAAAAALACGLALARPVLARGGRGTIRR